MCCGNLLGSIKLEWNKNNASQASHNRGESRILSNIKIGNAFLTIWENCNYYDPSWNVTTMNDISIDFVARRTNTRRNESFRN